MEKHCDNCKHSRRKLYLGNYEFPLKDYPECEPPELPDWAFDFVDKELKKNISRMNKIAWIKGRLMVLADMLEDRNQQYFANELRKLIEEVGD